MDVIAKILETFFTDLEIDPTSVTKMEVSSQKMSDRWVNFYIHVQPEREWFGIVSYFQGQWMAETHDYIAV